MRKKIKELTDEAAYAIENGEAIDWEIDEYEYEDQRMIALNEELFGILESTGCLEEYVERYEKAEKNLQIAETQIIKLIGKKSFYDIIELIDFEKGRLKGEIAKSLESYNDLNQYINDSENKYRK